MELVFAHFTHLDNTRLSFGCTCSWVHYRLFSVWTLVPVRLDQQLSDHSTVDEIASRASGLSPYLHNGELSSKAVKRRQWAGGGSAVGALSDTCWLEKPGERGRKREREKEGKRARKRQRLVVLGSGEENPRVLFGDADQESETRMSKNALRTGRRQAV
ncbi:hypothetical protein TNCV_2672931, partial [Trichonephila clavipes]